MDFVFNDRSLGSSAPVILSPITKDFTLNVDLKEIETESRSKVKVTFLSPKCEDVDPLSVARALMKVKKNSWKRNARDYTSSDMSPQTPFVKKSSSCERSEIPANDR